MLKTYGSGRSGFIHADEHATVGKLVTYALIDKRPWKAYVSQERDRLTETLTIQLNSAQGKMGPRLFKLQRLNVDMDTLFKEALILWINAQSELGRGAHPAIRSFLEKYDIEEYSLETAYRYYQRVKRG